MSRLEHCAKKIFETLWADYTSHVVDARTIEAALHRRKDTWSEDHIAFRTFPGTHTGRHVLAAVFEALGYREAATYHFEDKQLSAASYDPPMTAGRRAADACPKVFISEIIPDKFSPEFRRIIAERAAQVTATPVGAIQALAARVKAGDSTAEASLIRAVTDFLMAGPAWARPSESDYETLRRESEYAAWTLVFGGRVNHFTVSAQLMSSFDSLAALNQFIMKDLGIAMNGSGGYIKGSPEVQLEQSSTLAVPVTAQFQDGERTLPYAFVEFAFRHTLPGRTSDGMWESYYQGFRASNADKIFESTNRRDK